MAKQEEFDALIAQATEQLDTVSEQLEGIAVSVNATADAVTAEAEQIAAFIAANPAVDTSALQGVVDRLTVTSTKATEVADSADDLAGEVSDIFTPAEEEVPA